MVVGVDEAVSVEVEVCVVLAGAMLVVSCDVVCCEVEDKMVEVVPGVEDCGVVADDEDGGLELLIFATVVMMGKEVRKVARTYRLWWSCWTWWRRVDRVIRMLGERRAANGQALVTTTGMPRVRRQRQSEGRRKSALPSNLDQATRCSFPQKSAVAEGRER